MSKIGLSIALNWFEYSGQFRKYSNNFRCTNGELMLTCFAFFSSLKRTVMFILTERHDQKYYHDKCFFSGSIKQLGRADQQMNPPGW